MHITVHIYLMIGILPVELWRELAKVLVVAGLQAYMICLQIGLDLSLGPITVGEQLLLVVQHLFSSFSGILRVLSCEQNKHNTSHV